MSSNNPTDLTSASDNNIFNSPPSVPLMPGTNRTPRPRSDTSFTIASTSSGSSSSSSSGISYAVQTPPSPSILEVLGSPSPARNGGYGGYGGYRRKSSYGFTFSPLESSPSPDLDSSYDHGIPRIESSEASDGERGDMDRDEGEGRGRNESIGSVFFPLDNPQVYQPVVNAQIAQSGQEGRAGQDRGDDPGGQGVIQGGSDEDRVEDALSLSPSPLTALPIPIEPTYPPLISRGVEPPLPLYSRESSYDSSHPLSHPSGSGTVDKGRKSIKEVVRHRLERSKSSLRSLSHIAHHTHETDPDRGSLEDDNGVIDHTERERLEGATTTKRRRLKNLLSRSISRSQSSLSVQTVSPGYTTPLPTSLPLAQTGIPPNEPLERELEPLSPKGKGKGRMLPSSPIRHPIRPGYTSTSTSISIVSPQPGILARPRSISSPLISTIGHKRSLRKVDLFDMVLPRELRIQIFSCLLDLWIEQPGDGRWKGEEAGRRELIKLSRISRTWRDLCLDGQLWPIVHLTPFASVLHPSTYDKIVKRSAGFMTSFSIRGFDSLRTVDLLSSVGTDTLPRLRRLDLRGNKHITETDIVHLLRLAPNLVSLNLKGVQAVSSFLLSHIAELSLHLEDLDLSICRGLSLNDIASFINRLTFEQASKYNGLRIARIQEEHSDLHRPSPGLFTLIAQKMPNLQVLDLNMCDISDEDLTDWKDAIDEVGVPSKLSHLIISGNTSLTIRTLQNLTGRVPNMTKFEMAGIPRMFRRGTSNRNSHVPLCDLLLSMPLLERLDLEGTGEYGGVNDHVLRALTGDRENGAGRREGMGDGAAERTAGMRLREVRLGYARGITSEELVRLIRRLPVLQRLEVDNTDANDTVMQEFHRRRLHGPSASISLIDCMKLTAYRYSSYASTSRPRDGFDGFEASPFGYDQSELPSSEKGVIKTFQSWKRVSPGRPWREMREGAEAMYKEGVRVREDEGGSERSKMERREKRGGSWWIEGEDDKVCVVM